MSTGRKFTFLSIKWSQIQQKSECAEKLTNLWDASCVCHDKWALRANLRIELGDASSHAFDLRSWIFKISPMFYANVFIFLSEELPRDSEKPRKLVCPSVTLQKVCYVHKTISRLYLRFYTHIIKDCQLVDVFCTFCLNYELACSSCNR